MMNITLNSKMKLILTIAIALLIFGMILREHFNGAVVSHYLLDNKDLPKVSNWWGLLTIPVISWFTFSNLQKRNRGANDQQLPVSKSQLYRFLGALLFAVALTVMFRSALDLNKYLLLITFVLALFIPLYLPEFYLGFVLGMAYGFGGILPVIFGLFLLVIYAIEYKLIRRGVLFILDRLR